MNLRFKGLISQKNQDMKRAKSTKSSVNWLLVRLIRINFFRNRLSATCGLLLEKRRGEPPLWRTLPYLKFRGRKLDR